MNFKNLIFLFVLEIVGCTQGQNDVIPSQNRGDIVSVTKMGTYSAEQIKQVLVSQGYNIPSADHLTHTVDLNKVVYLTSDNNGGLVEVSGTLLIPKVEEVFPILSI